MNEFSFALGTVFSRIACFSCLVVVISGCTGGTEGHSSALVASSSLSPLSSSSHLSVSSQPIGSSSVRSSSSRSSSSAASSSSAVVVTGLERGVYTLVSGLSGKLLEVANASNAEGANVIQWSDLGGPNQRWIIREVVDGYYSVVNVQTGKALTVTTKPLLTAPMWLSMTTGKVTPSFGK